MTDVWVVGVDGSDHSRTALRWTMAQSRGRDVLIQATSAWQLPVSGMVPLGGSNTGVALEEMEAATHAEVEALIAEVDDPEAARVEARTAHGGEAQVLLEATEGADLLVLGTRGRGGFKRLLLGSVSHQCATHAKVPTVIVPPETRAEPVASAVVGVDGSINSQGALRWLLGFLPRGRDVAAVGAWNPPVLTVDELAGISYEELGDDYRRRFESSIDEVEYGMEKMGPYVEKKLVVGDARDVLTEAGARADLLVVGTQGHRGLTAAVMGSTTTSLLHHPPCPVVVVPGDPVPG